MSLGIEVGPGHIVLYGDPAPQKGHSPQFAVNVCCGQTAGWIEKNSRCRLCIGLGYIVLDRDTAPPAPTERVTAAPPLFGQCLLWQNDRPSQQLLSSCEFCHPYIDMWLLSSASPIKVCVLLGASLSRVLISSLTPLVCCSNCPQKVLLFLEIQTG